MDWGFVAKHFGSDFQKKGGEIMLNYEAEKFVDSSNPEYPIRIVSRDNKVK